MKIIFVLLAIFFLAGHTPAQTRVDDLIRREMKTRSIPGVQAAVVHHGKIVFEKAYGAADLQNSVPVTTGTIFPINSCTKAFTGVAVMQLVEEGKVNLSMPVSRYLDGLPAAWQPVTIRQLLTHVSGLPDMNRVLNPGTFGLDGIGDEAAALARVEALPMDFQPGERFSYNQTNYFLLGKIIDKFRGKPFAEVYRERQFQIAGMKDTGFGDSRDIIPHMSQSYRLASRIDGINLGGNKLINAYGEFPAFRRTASGMNSTAGDLARWIIALQQGKLFSSKETLATLWTAGTYSDGSPTQWALGWITKPRPVHHAVGITGGGRAAIFVYPEDELAIVILTNLGGGYPDEFVDELAGIYNPAIAASDPITALRLGLEKRGYDNANMVFDDLKRSNPAFKPTETDLNDWAYRLMNGVGRVKEALSVFKLIVSLYPTSGNAYDSLGEAYMKSGDKLKAIENYEMSLKLDPKNTNAVNILKKLR